QRGPAEPAPGLYPGFDHAQRARGQDGSRVAHDQLASSRIDLTIESYQTDFYCGPRPQEYSMSSLTESVDLQTPPPALVFTDAAATKVKDLLLEEGNPDLKLRVFVQGGGCSGFQYGFTFDET